SCNRLDIPFRLLEVDEFVTELTGKALIWICPWFALVHDDYGCRPLLGGRIQFVTTKGIVGHCATFEHLLVPPFRIGWICNLWLPGQHQNRFASDPCHSGVVPSVLRRDDPIPTNMISEPFTETSGIDWSEMAT